LHQQRIHANLRALDGLAASATGAATPPEQRRGYLLDVSRVWEEIGSALQLAFPASQNG
jgi:hypothetical protein